MAGRAAPVLRSVATRLTEWRHRVLCLDLAGDLESAKSPGMGALLADFEAGRVRDLADYAVRREERAASMSAAPRPVDWGGLYASGFGEFLDACRTAWLCDYDFVLVNAPAGRDDLVGIAVAQLPDVLVPVAAADDSSLAEFVTDIGRARDRLPFDQGPLHVVPVGGAVPPALTASWLPVGQHGLLKALDRPGFTTLAAVLARRLGDPLGAVDHPGRHDGREQRLLHPLADDVRDDLRDLLSDLQRAKHTGPVWRQLNGSLTVVDDSYAPTSLAAVVRVLENAGGVLAQPGEDVHPAPQSSAVLLAALLRRFGARE